MQRLLPDASQDVCDLSRLTFENVRSAKCEGSSPAAVVELQFMKVVGEREHPRDGEGRRRIHRRSTPLARVGE